MKHSENGEEFEVKVDPRLPSPHWGAYRRMGAIEHLYDEVASIECAQCVWGRDEVAEVAAYPWKECATTLAARSYESLDECRSEVEDAGPPESRSDAAVGRGISHCVFEEFSAGVEERRRGDDSRRHDDAVRAYDIAQAEAKRRLSAWKAICPRCIGCSFVALVRPRMGGGRRGVTHGISALIEIALRA